jgi:hypothetical protein
MDIYERDVYLELILPSHPKSQELKIWKHLNSNEQRKDWRNHTSLLHSLEAGNWTLLVTPAWTSNAEDSHCAHLGELLDMGMQLLEVR